MRIAQPEQKRWARADVGAGSMYRRFHQNGANAVDPQDDTKAVFNSAKAIEALEFEKAGMHKDRSVVQGRLEVDRSEGRRGGVQHGRTSNLLN